MNSKGILILFSLFVLSFSLAIDNIGHTADEWKSRSIYQLLTDRFATTNKVGQLNLTTYCGGTFKGIQSKLDYIKGMGFDAIWISPITKNAENAFHGYYTTNFSEVNEHFGTKQELKELVNACHEKDIWVIFDVVLNHVAPIIDEEELESIFPFNKIEHYHYSICVEKEGTQEKAENCWLNGILTDLRQENEFVNETLRKWLKEEIIEQYKIDGLRLAYANNVPKKFWEVVVKELGGLFTLGNIADDSFPYVAEYQGDGLFDGVNNYPLFYHIKDSFCRTGDMKYLAEYIKKETEYFKDPTKFGIFFDNHDNDRFLYWCNDKSQLKNAAVLLLLFKGIPIFYYGDEQYFDGGKTDPERREPLFPNNYSTSTDLYLSLKKLNDLRKSSNIATLNYQEINYDENYYSFTRGTNDEDKILVVLTNGKKSSFSFIIKDHKFKPGTKLCDLFDTNDCVEVKEDGILINMETEPKVYSEYTVNTVQDKDSKGSYLLSSFFMALIMLLI